MTGAIMKAYDSQTDQAEQLELYPGGFGIGVSDVDVQCAGDNKEYDPQQDSGCSTGRFSTVESNRQIEN